MKEIILTQGQVAKVDDEDFERINHLHWYARKTHNKFYAAYKVKKHGKSTTFYMHREIMHYPAGMHIDHIDGDGLNNQKSNLRICTCQENQRNRHGAQSNSKSGIKGVSWHKSSNRWRAVISINKKYKQIGSFKTKEEAALAYNEAAKKYFGDFARLNNI